VRPTVAHPVLLRKVLPPTRHAAACKCGWREPRQWHRNDTARRQWWNDWASRGEKRGKLTRATRWT